PQHLNCLGLLGPELRRGLGRLSGLLQRRDETVSLGPVAPLRLATSGLDFIEPRAQTVTLRAHRLDLLERGIPLAPSAIERALESLGDLSQRLWRAARVGLLAAGLLRGLELV